MSLFKPAIFNLGKKTFVICSFLVMNLSQQHCSNFQAEDVKSIIKICNSTTQNFESIGNLFINKFSNKYNVLTMGSALITALGELSVRTKLRQRLVLIYLIYKVNDLDIPPSEVPKKSKKEIIENLQFHPFLPFLLFLMGGENATSYGSTNFIYTFAPIVLHAKEKYMLGLLLTGRCDEVVKRTPIDFAQMVIHQEEVFDLRWLAKVVKLQQNNYSNLAKISTPAFLRMFEEIKNLDNSEDLDASLVDVLTKHRLSDVLLPSFYRFVPTLMPPSDDEFQFLYPFLLEPLWIHSETSRSETNDECGIEVDTGSSYEAESSIMKPFASLSIVNTDTDHLKFRDKKTGGSLPCSPKTSAFASVNGDTRSARAASVCSLPFSLDLSSAFEEIALSATVESSQEGSTMENLETTKLSKSDAIQLLSKTLKGVIARHDTQRLAYAISSDPTIVDSVEITPTYFPKLIKDNPTVAAAVILDRARKNPGEISVFFDILTEMKLCVQGMEVVNKLCDQLDFPQEYLNRFISSCIQRCDDSSLSAASLCRQVRAICVFLSSLMFKKPQFVQPLSVELQSFALKYSHVREAASLYQAIVLAMQEEVQEDEKSFTEQKLG
uniref:CCR4-NOT transcription complex subunit 11 n=1 Tax=Syphacia muris TaxID=451379 RepID=A0A0N5AF33_9BILA